MNDFISLFLNEHLLKHNQLYNIILLEKIFNIRCCIYDSVKKVFISTETNKEYNLSQVVSFKELSLNFNPNNKIDINSSFFKWKENKKKEITKLLYNEPTTCRAYIAKLSFSIVKEAFEAGFKFNNTL